MAKRVRLDTPEAELQSLREESASAVATEIVAFAATNGIIIASPQDPAHPERVSFTHAPVTLYPDALPSWAFKTAKSLAIPMNLLVEAVSKDEEWLLETLSETIKGDPFTARLVDLFKQHGGSRATQPLALGVHRSDYMVDAGTKRLLQVELNTIASSFACLSTRISRMHSSVRAFRPALYPGTVESNAAETDIAAGLAAAHAKVLESLPRTQADDDESTEYRVLFVVQAGERNFGDQRHLEYALNAKNVLVDRLSLGEIHSRCALDASKRLVNAKARRVYTVVYFRAGYTPDDYHSEDEWKAKYTIEASLAVKCPTVAYHLVGAKKVQQRLAEKNQLERFVKDPGQCEAIKSCFAGLWSLGPDQDPSIIKQAIAHPEKYVVKPQREGGGNNFYNADLVRVLTKSTPAELSALILMERIFPPITRNILLKQGVPVSTTVLSELGIYSVYLSDGSVNAEAGYLLRTKADGTDEGGVASGFACLSSVRLVDEL